MKLPVQKLRKKVSSEALQVLLNELVKPVKYPAERLRCAQGWSREVHTEAKLAPDAGVL